MLLSTPALLIATLTLSHLAHCVNLVHHARPQCYGTTRTCSNIGPGVCCQSRSRYFVSNSCQGCTSTDLSFIYRISGGNYCGIGAGGTNGGTCVGGQNLKGSTWCRICGTRKARRDDDASAAGLPEAPACENSVFENVITIDGRHFRINYDVPENMTEELQAFQDSGAPVESIAPHLLQYEIGSPEERRTYGNLGSS